MHTAPIQIVGWHSGTVGDIFYGAFYCKKNMKRFIGIFIALIMLTLICCSTSSITPVVIETPNNNVNTEETIEEPRDSVKISRKKKVQYNLSGYSTKIVDIREIEINGHLYIVGTAFGGASDGGSSILAYSHD